MDVFNLIKYPITEEFRREDLDRIPDSIIIDWINSLTGSTLRERPGHPGLQAWIFMIRESSEVKLAKLKELIAEYIA
jgi:hypothetical protein